MTDGADQAEFPRNHNFANMPLEEQATIAISEALSKANTRWKELEVSASKAPAAIDDEHTAEKFTTLIAQMSALEGAIDLAHAGAKAPFLEAGRIVDGVKNRLIEQVRAKKAALQGTLTAYQVEKQRRVEAERAALRAQDEAAGEPEPSMVDSAAQDRRHVTIRSGEGASSHLVDEIDVEILDVKKIPKRYLDRPKVLAAIRAELKPDLKKGDKIAGAKGIPRKQSRVRRG